MKFFAKLTRLRLGVLLPTFGFLLIAAVWGAVAVRLAEERSEAIAFNAAAVAGSTNLLEERTFRILRQIDQFAEAVNHYIDDGADAAELGHLLKRRGLLPVDGALRIAVLDARGTLIASNPESGHLELGHRDYFIRHLDSPSTELEIAKPVAGALTGKSMIPVTRRLNRPNGSLAGVLVVTLNATFLSEIYDSALLGETGSLALVGTDDVIRARRVGSAVAVGGQAPFSSFVARTGLPGGGTVVASSPIDGVRRIISFRQVHHYPLMAMVGISEEKALAGFARRRTLHLFFATATSLVVAAFIALMLYQSRDLIRSRQRTRTLAATLDASGDLVVTVLPNGELTYANPAARHTLGIAPDGDDPIDAGAAETDLNACFPTWVVQRLVSEAEPVARREGHWIGETAILKDGAEMPISHMLIAHHGTRGELEYYSHIMRDISAAKRAERALRNSEERLRRVTDRLPMRVAFIDTHERCQFSNLEYQRDFGIEASALRGRTLHELLGDAAYEEVRPYVRRALAGETVVFEQERGLRSGYRCTQATYIPEFGELGEVVGFHMIVQDITATKLEEQRLLKLAELDGLTGLANRTSFERALGEAMERSRSAHTLMALMYLDLDHFKTVNDTFGHAVGDSLLEDFGKRLCSSVRAVDTVARIGGDEFTIVLEDLPYVETPVAIASKIIANMNTPFTEGPHRLSVTTSIGVALYRGGKMNQQELLASADAMLYSAKKAGRNQFCMTPDP